MEARLVQIDTISSVMNAAGDKMVTTGTATQNPRPRKGSNKGPCATVKFGSASVPIYLSESNGRKSFIISHYRDGKRLRQTFTDLAAAKKEAMFVAQRIQSGMQHVAVFPSTATTPSRSAPRSLAPRAAATSVRTIPPATPPSSSPPATTSSLAFKQRERVMANIPRRGRGGFRTFAFWPSHSLRCAGGGIALGEARTSVRMWERLRPGRTEVRAPLPGVHELRILDAVNHHMSIPAAPLFVPQGLSIM